VASDCDDETATDEEIELAVTAGSEIAAKELE
jgi:hypothetical protein